MTKWRKRAGDVLSGLWILSSVFGIQTGATFLHCDNVTADAFEICCLCYVPENCDTNQTCPLGYYPTLISTDNCRFGIDTSTQMTLTTTKDATETTTTDDGDDQTAFNRSSPQNQNVICYKCRTKEFFDGIQCSPCDVLCHSCNGAGEENCDPCKFEYENRCVEQCPNDTDEIPNADKGGIVCHNKTDNANGTVGETGDSDSFPVAIVAGSIGGGVAMVLVVVILIVAFRRKRTRSRTNGRTRMSEIIEDRGTVEAKKEDTGQPTKKRHPDYENQPKTIATLPRDIENQSDSLLRYTKDPTANIQEGRTKKQDPSRDSGLYQNAAMIRVHTNFKDKRLSQEELNNQLEKEEVENLPTAPPPPTVKKKGGIMNRFSKRFAKPKTGSQIELVEEDQAYMDMEGVSTPHNEVAESVEQPVVEEQEEQEEYENVQIGRQMSGAEHDEEDYENLQKTPKQSKMKKGGAKDIKHDKKSYENDDVILRLKAADKPRRGDASHTQGVHEEIEKAGPGHGTNNVEPSEQSRSQGSSKGEETPVDLSDAQLEDDENTEGLEKNVVVLEQGGVESPYENVQFRRK